MVALGGNFPEEIFSAGGKKWIGSPYSKKAIAARDRGWNRLFCMVRKKVLLSLLWGVCVLAATHFSFAAHAESFEKPLKTTVLDLGRSQYLRRNDSQRVKLTCYYYPNFMIKQVNDPGYKGAFLIAIVPEHPGYLAPCTHRPSAGQRVFPDRGDSYFEGVKRNLVFLVAEGGDGASLFAVYDCTTREKIFGDLSLGYDHPISFVEISGEQIALRYLRVIPGSCSVPKDGTTCWSKFKELIGLKDSPMLACDYHGEALNDPSVIDYPVEVSLFPKPSIKALANPIKCWPAD